jgi:hypothetical protein
VTLSFVVCCVLPHGVGLLSPPPPHTLPHTLLTPILCVSLPLPPPAGAAGCSHRRAGGRGSTSPGEGGGWWWGSQFLPGPEQDRRPQ